MSGTVMPLRVSDTQFEQAIKQLSEFVAIPSVSNPDSSDYSMETLEKAANFASAKLKEIGFSVRTPRFRDSAPFVIAERIVDVAAPTILLYAHYDVQPVDRSQWKSDPFVLEERDNRLYGRGASDDKGGIIAILTALEICINAKIKLPNVRILFEGEEEYNSSHMGDLLKQEAKNLHAHAMIVLDGLNRDVDTGTLTSSTRGLANIHLKVVALDKPVHSGIGCLAPDPGQALAALIYSLRDPRAIPGFMDGCEPLSDQEKAILRQSSISSETHAKDLGVKQGAQLRGNPQDSIYERIVNEPSISTVNFKCGQPNGGNSIQDSATCTIGIRILPGQNPDKIATTVINYLQSQSVMYNVEVKIDKPEAGAWAWKANLAGVFSTAYFKALEENFPSTCAMPCGGALPLLREFQAAFPAIEIIAPGVEDPKTDAHSHNESQDKLLFRRSIDTLISFLDKGQKIKV